MWLTQPPIKWVSESFSDKIVGARNWPLYPAPRLKWAKHYLYSPCWTVLWTKTTSRYPPPFSPPHLSLTLLLHLPCAIVSVTGFFCISVYYLANSLIPLPWRCISTFHSNFGAILTAHCGIMSWVGEIYFHTSLSWFSTVYSTTSLKPISLTSRLSLILLNRTLLFSLVNLIFLFIYLTPHH